MLVLIQLEIKYLVLVIQSKKTEYNTKINKIDKKITDHNHDNYVTTPEFNNFAKESLNLRFKQANLSSESDIAN